MDLGGNLKNIFAGFNNTRMTGKIGSKMISMCIVPVKVKHGDSKDVITTYAIWDNCSQDSFIHDNLVKKFGVHGLKTILNNKTLRGKKTENNMVEKDIKLTGMSDDCSLLSLPKLYIRRKIPIVKEEIDTPAKIKEWKRLRSILNKIVQKDNLQVGLMISANCMKALEPTKIIHCEDGIPYAYKTRLS